MLESGRRQVYEYAKAHFYYRSAIYAAIIVAVGFLLKGFIEIAFLWFVGLVALLFGVLLVFGISPLFTSHWLTRTRLVLRQGVFFKAIIPVSGIESVEEYNGEFRMGLSLSLRSGILFVTSGKYDLVEIELREPKVFPQLLWFSARRIVFNVDKRDALISALRERIELLAPIET